MEINVFALLEFFTKMLVLLIALKDSLSSDLNVFLVNSHAKDVLDQQIIV